MLTNTPLLLCAPPSKKKIHDFSGRKSRIAGFIKKNHTPAHPHRQARVARYCDKYPPQSYLFPSLQNRGINGRNYWLGASREIGLKTELPTFPIHAVDSQFLTLSTLQGLRCRRQINSCYFKGTGHTVIHQSLVVIQCAEADHTPAHGVSCW